MYQYLLKNIINKNYFSIDEEKTRLKNKNPVLQILKKDFKKSNLHKRIKPKVYRKNSILNYNQIFYF